MFGRFIRCGVLLGLIAGISCQPDAKPRFFEKNGFDLSNALVPIDHIVSGGPPRDGIPAIDKPHFVAVSEAGFLNDEDVVISVSYRDETRAYPLRILTWHEVVNDEIGEQAIAVTYCPLCGTGMVFDRSVKGRILSFGVSGLLYQSDVLLYDRQTESLWSQLARKAVAGPLVDTPLRWLPSQQLRWDAWKSQFPQGQVLSTQTGFQRDYTVNPYAAYETDPQPLFAVPEYRRDLPAKSWVLGVLLNREAKAYPLKQLPAAVRSLIRLGENSWPSITTPTPVKQRFAMPQTVRQFPMFMYTGLRGRPFIRERRSGSPNKFASAAALPICRTALGSADAPAAGPGGTNSCVARRAKQGPSDTAARVKRELRGTRE